LDGLLRMKKDEIKIPTLIDITLKKDFGSKIKRNYFPL